MTLSADASAGVHIQPDSQHTSLLFSWSFRNGHGYFPDGLVNCSRSRRLIQAVGEQETLQRAGVRPDIFESGDIGAGHPD